MKVFAAAEALWREWNARINVISRKDEDNIYAHHILHSLAIAEYLRRFYPEDYAWMSAAGCHCATVLDVGTGGGFPGIPLAMTLPAARFTLCDSIGKKVRVAQAVAEGLGLQNVSCVQSRVEDLPGEWDWVVSRAVTSLENFYPWVRGKYRRSILYLKGGDVAAETSALQRRFHIPASKIRIWPIAPWVSGLRIAEASVLPGLAAADVQPILTIAPVSLSEYYAEKYVIEIAR